MRELAQSHLGQGEDVHLLLGGRSLRFWELRWVAGLALRRSLGDGAKGPDQLAVRAGHGRVDVFFRRLSITTKKIAMTTPVTPKRVFVSSYQGGDDGHVPPGA